MAPRTVVVVNPSAQNGQLGRQWPSIAGELRRELSGFEEAITSGPGDATGLCRQALHSGADTVVAVGGDGTISEVANGFFDGDQPVRPEAAMGIIPVGTGGDFRKTAGIPRDIRGAAQILARREIRPIDIGHVELVTRDGSSAAQVFINIASFGLSGLVDELVNESSKRLGGKLSFMVATARAGLRYQNQRVRLVFDGDEAGSADVTVNTVAVANGRYFGGGMYVAPEAELDDGRFDVVAIGDLSKWEFVRHGRKLYAGTHLHLDKVSHRRAVTVRAEAIGGEQVRLDIDGETPGVLPATFRILPRALKLIAPTVVA